MYKLYTQVVSIPHFGSIDSTLRMDEFYTQDVLSVHTGCKNYTLIDKMYEGCLLVVSMLYSGCITEDVSVLYSGCFN